MEEEWRDVVGYEEYFSVSNYGKLFSKRSNKLLKQHKNKNGYLNVSTRFGGRSSKAVTFKMHRLVAECFLEPPNEILKEWATTTVYGRILVLHIDGDKTNNNVTNLKWGTYIENSEDYYTSDVYKDKSQQNINKLHPTCKFSIEDVLYIRQNYKPKDKKFGARALAIKFGTFHQRILDIVNHKTYKTVVSQ